MHTGGYKAFPPRRNLYPDMEFSRRFKNEIKYFGEYSVYKDYFEMGIQYGYVILFSACLPLTPLLACTNNFFEGGVDFLKVRESHMCAN